MVDAFHTKVTATTNSISSLSSALQLDGKHRSALQRSLRDLLRSTQLTASVHVTALAPPHLGLGSKTSLILSSLRAVATALHLPGDPSHLQQLSGRGGTSGIGVNGFFYGGFLVDGGHPKSTAPFQPSRASSPSSVPPILCGFHFPEAWHVWLLIPTEKQERIDGARELAFFQKNTPLRVSEVHRAACIALLEIATSIATADFSAFREGLASFQAVGFKKREISNQPGAASRLRSLHRQGLAAGMSSMGPLLFAVGESLHSPPVIEGMTVYGPFCAANQGAHVRVEST